MGFTPNRSAIALTDSPLARASKIGNICDWCSRAFLPLWLGRLAKKHLRHCRPADFTCVPHDLQQCTTRGPLFGFSRSLVLRCWIACLVHWNNATSSPSRKPLLCCSRNWSSVNLLTCSPFPVVTVTQFGLLRIPLGLSFQLDNVSSPP